MPDQKCCLLRRSYLFCIVVCFAMMLDLVFVLLAILRFGETIQVLVNNFKHDSVSCCHTFPMEFFFCTVWFTEGWSGGLFCSFTAIVCKDSISGLRASSIVVFLYFFEGLKGSTYCYFVYVLLHSLH
jgi:hypothetical protein